MIFILLAGCSKEPEVVSRPKGLNPLPISALVADLAAPRRHWRVYNFWATWCRPCLAEMPGLRKFGEQNPDVDLVFVNLDQPKLHPTRVRATIERLGLGDFEHLALDDDDPAGAIHGIAGWPDSIPVTLVVSPAGERTKQYNTAIEPAVLERAIAGH